MSIFLMRVLSFSRTNYVAMGILSNLKYGYHTRECIIYTEHYTLSLTFNGIEKNGNFLILFICAPGDFRDINFACFSGKRKIQ